MKTQGKENCQKEFPKAAEESKKWALKGVQRMQSLPQPYAVQGHAVFASTVFLVPEAHTSETRLAGFSLPSGLVHRLLA